MESKRSKSAGRTPRKVIRAKAASRYPMVRIAPNVPSIARRVTPFGDKRKCHMTYYTPVTLSSGAAGLAGNYVFAVNGLYDTDITGTGHQPLGFDQLMVMYDHYTVTNAKITVDFHNPNSNLVVAALSVSDAATTITDANRLVENGLVAYGSVPNSTTAAGLRLSQKCSMSRFMGRPGILTEDDFRGDVNSNPAELAYFHLSAWSFAAAAVDLHCYVLIEYDVILTEPKKLTSS